MLLRFKLLEKFSLLKVMKDKKVIIFTILVGSCGSGYFVYKNSISMKDEAVNSKGKSSYIYLPRRKHDALPSGMINTSGLSPITEYAFKGLISYKLLRMVKSDDQKIKDRVINEISTTFHLEDFQYRTLAQAIDMKTSIGLARTPHVSLKFFLPPSPLIFHPKMSEEEHFLQIFSAVSVSATNEFIQFKTKEATDLLLSKYELNSCMNSFGVPDFEQYYQNQRNNSPSDYKTPLFALLAHSTISSHRLIMVQKQLLSLLHILYRCKDDDDVKCVIAQIIANTAIDENLHQHIFVTGWIGTLASWSRSPNVELNLSAAKALANMDRSYEHNNFYDDGIYLLYPPLRIRNFSPIADVVFVHGVMGGVFRTWRQHDSMRPISDKKKSIVHSVSEENEEMSYTYCWPKDWLPGDLPHIRVLAVDYYSYFTEWKKKYHTHQGVEDLQTRSSNMLMKLASAGVGKRPVVFVGHSMGGIIVKQMLVDASESKEEATHAIAQNTAGIVFYSVPHKGTEVASFSPHYQMILKPSTEIQQLKKGSPELLKLHEHFKRLVNDHGIKCLSFGETIKSKIGLNWNAILVPHDSADPELGEFYEIPANHLSTCKPLSKASASYQHFVQFLKKLLSNDDCKYHTEVSCPNIDWSTFF